MSVVERVLATEEALALIDLLKEKHGPVMFHQSGGCCDGSSPMCYPEGDLLIGKLRSKYTKISGESRSFFTFHQSYGEKDGGKD